MLNVLSLVEACSNSHTTDQMTDQYGYIISKNTFAKMVKSISLTPDGVLVSLGRSIQPYLKQLVMMCLYLYLDLLHNICLLDCSTRMECFVVVLPLVVNRQISPFILLLRLAILILRIAFVFSY